MDNSKPESVSPAPEAKTRFPWWVALAAIIWIVYGTLSLAALVMRFVSIQSSTETDGGGFLCASIIPFFIAIVFLHVGWSTLRGQAKGTASNGCGSIIWGCLHLIFVPPILHANNQAFTRLIDYSVYMFPVSLLIAGLLALAGGKRYRRWRDAKGY